MAEKNYAGWGGRGWRRWGWAAGSVVFHAFLLAALVAATDEEEQLAAEVTDEEVTYVDISSFPPPPPPAAATAPEPEPSRPEPRQPQPTPRTPRPQPRAQTPPRATDIAEPTLDSLPEPLGDVAPAAPIPAPVAEGPPAGAVSAGAQAGGQPGGVEGGVAGGRVGGEVGAAPPPEGGTFVEAVVDRRAELRNRRELPRIMERLYPPVLRDSGIGGRVVVQFVVDTNGRIDMSTVKIMSSDHDGLEEPTRRALREFRFSPAKMGDRSVRMLTQLPIVWQVES